MFKKFYWKNLDWVGKTLLIAIVLAACMKIYTVLTLIISYDEFYNLNLVYNFTKGDMSSAYQTMVYRAFSWLPNLPISEIDQIVVGRFIMFLLACLTCLFIYKTSLRFASVNASLFGVLCYLSFYFVILNLTSFRADGVATAILMATIWLVSDPQQSLKKAILSGFLIALSGVFTAKSIFYMPIIATFLLTRWVVSRWALREFLNGLVMLAVALTCFVIITYFHGQMVQAPVSDSSFLDNTLKHSFLKNSMYTQFLYLLSSTIFNPVLWLFIAYGLFVLLASIYRDAPKEKINAINIISLIFPVTTLLYYVHVSPYYYSFVLAPAAIIVAYGADQYLSKPRKFPFEVPVLTCIGILIIGFGYSTLRGQQYQRDVLKNIHDIFPNSESYLDYCGMVPSFDRIVEPGLFITPDVNFGSVIRNGPFMEDLVRKRQPKFFIANSSVLDLDGMFSHIWYAKLSSGDDAFVRQNYLHHWGPVYIAGKNLRGVHTQSTVQFEIIIEGTYTLRGPAAIIIDGTEVEPNSTVYLSTGQHIATDVGNVEYQLIWGDNLVKPKEIEKPNRIFWFL